MINLREKIENEIKRKTENILYFLHKNLKIEEPHRFCIAGGCFGKEINDIDIFPLKDENELTSKNFDGKAELIVQTPNSKTYKVNDQIIQLCNYSHETLENLVDSFDFAHTQCGVEVSLHQNGNYKVEKIYITDECILAWALQKTWFIGSEYPFSSLIRASKYHQRGLLTKHEFLQTNLKIIIEIVKRGFRDQNDLKDQLDSIDLGYVITDSQEFNTNALLTLRGLKDDQQNND